MKRHFTQEQKARAVERLASGERVEDIAADTGCSVMSVYAWRLQQPGYVPRQWRRSGGSEAGEVQVPRSSIRRKPAKELPTPKSMAPDTTLLPTDHELLVVDPRFLDFSAYEGRLQFEIAGDKVDVSVVMSGSFPFPGSSSRVPFSDVEIRTLIRRLSFNRAWFRKEDEVCREVRAELSHDNSGRCFGSVSAVISIPCTQLARVGLAEIWAVHGVRFIRVAQDVTPEMIRRVKEIADASISKEGDQNETHSHHL